MEKKAIILIEGPPEEIAKGLKKYFDEYYPKDHRPQEPEFTRDRLTRTQAAKLAGVSLPTFAKLIKNGTFPEHGFGTRNKFYLRSEIIEALRREADKKDNQ
jgi:excisionase family DNA binding protein